MSICNKVRFCQPHLLSHAMSFISFFTSDIRCDRSIATSTDLIRFILLQILLRIRSNWKFELTVHFKSEIIRFKITPQIGLVRISNKLFVILIGPLWSQHLLKVLKERHCNYLHLSVWPGKIAKGKWCSRGRLVRPWLRWGVRWHSTRRNVQQRE